MGSPLAIRVRRVTAIDAVALRVWLRAGERHCAQPGAACLAGRMLDEGTESRDYLQVAADAEAKGVAIHAGGGYEALGLALDGPAEEAARMIDWAAEIARQPRFDPERWAWQRELAQAELVSQEDEPQVLTGWRFLEQLYGNHPRGRPLAGSRVELERRVVTESRSFHQYAVGAGVVVSLAGAVDEAWAADRLEEGFAGLAAFDGSPPAPVGEPEAGARRQFVDLPGDQAHLFMGRRTVDRDHLDLPALELAGVVLGAGAGLAGRIPQRVREREGLAYTASVDTAAGASADAGRLVLYAATGVEQVERAEAAMREELARFVDEGVSDEELAAARTFLEGQEIFRRESARQWAELMGEAELTGLPVDQPEWARRWSSVGPEELLSAARRWLDPSDLYVTVGLPEAAATAAG